ncbi:MAG TPA: hypothetical protein DDY78_14195 [Planctomycetales bacterium]|jgi:thiol-disulfide isomerase/thioredoxin|nr:hypothetical protein [Planctomycetales bacterium]
MATKLGKMARKAKRWAMAGCIVLGGAGSAWAGNAPPVSTMLRYHPAQEGVSITTPKPEEEAGCKVELVKGAGKGSGWALKDANGKTLRVFFSHDQTNLDVWSYYKDGVEVYRESETEGGGATGKADQFRWLNADGMKWGVDEAKHGQITHWKAISPEEVSQEILHALTTKDFARLQALMISEAEMKQIGLSEEQAAHIRDLEKGAASKFQKTIADLPKLSSGKPTWVHLETAAPECTPAEPGSSRPELLKYSHGSLLFEVGGATEWVQTGEMIQVGSAWRIVEGPTAGAAPVETTTGADKVVGDSDPKLMALINELTELDKKTPDGSNAAANPLMARHHMLRVDQLEKIAAAAKPDQRESWYRQMADSLSTAAQNSPAGDTAAMKRLVGLEESMAKVMPGSNLAAYVTYREMQAEYAVHISQGTGTKEKEDSFAKVQQAWVDRLTKFVETYPKADDTPDALLQLGMVCEFLNKDVEAKNWYLALVKHFPDATQGKKAGGSIRRLESEGQAFKLAGPTLADPNVVYDIEQAHGKVVVVYYWASWNSQSATDFNKLKAMMDTEGKDVELVAINLDNTIKEARDFLTRSPAVGVHLYQNGGLDSKLANDYGIVVLPELFLIGKDGKVVSRNVQINNLEDEVKKLLK